MTCPTCNSKDAKVVTFDKEVIYCDKCKDSPRPCCICGKPAVEFCDNLGYCIYCI